MPSKTVRRLVKGPQGPTLRTLLALGEGLRVYSIDQLLGFSQTTFFSRLDAVEGALGGMTDVLYRQVTYEP